jgi:hypothetical protein
MLEELNNHQTQQRGYDGFGYGYGGFGDGDGNSGGYGGGYGGYGNGYGGGYGGYGNGESDPYPLDAVDLLVRLAAREAVTRA